MTPASGVRPGRERVAVIGSGVSGLTAAYLLQRRFDVTLFEAAGRLGGHADTHDVVTPDAGTVPVDTGFIVYNDTTYPHLRRLLAELGVRTQPTDMSMSIHCEGCGLEYAGWPRCGGRVRSTAVSGRAGFCEDAGAGEEVPSAGQGNGRRRGRPAHPAGFLERWRLLALLRPSLRRSGRLVRMVCFNGRRDGVPRSIPLRIPRQPRDVVGDRVPGVADHQWRLPRIRRADREGAARGAHRDTGALGHPEPRMGSKSVMIVTR